MKLYKQLLSELDGLCESKTIKTMKFGRNTIEIVKTKNGFDVVYDGEVVDTQQDKREAMSSAKNFGKILKL